jgi:methylphosphotriester-DNA--protein-cysteine methyltransferase
MTNHNDVTPKEVFSQIKSGQITFGGNKNLKIYGRLNCKSGKRMKMQNRVFFKNETEARHFGFRPCGHCMREGYLEWKKFNSNTL